jgi:sterol desaturase/sphingolipid hydroxylase (fatty acid hydroxylase superfamily)
MFDFNAAIQLFLQDDLIGYVVPLFVGAVIVEAIWSRVRGRGLYRLPDTGTSLLMLVASAIFEIVPKIALIGVMIVFYEISPLRGVVGHQPWAWVLLFFLDDFTYYWFHRLNHEMRFFWAGHVNHHSSEYLNYGTALRQGVGERIYKVAFWLWLPLVGFDPGMVLLMMGLNLSYQFWVHTEAVRRLPDWFEAVFNTPSHHRVHHGSNTRYLDRNHAGVLIVWDKLFGTFSPEADEEPVVYGLTESLNTFSPYWVLVHGYAELWRDMRRATTWRQRWQYLTRAPGWSHDGPDKRAKTLRAQLARG